GEGVRRADREDTRETLTERPRGLRHWFRNDTALVAKLLLGESLDPFPVLPGKEAEQTGDRVRAQTSSPVRIRRNISRARASSSGSRRSISWRRCRCACTWAEGTPGSASALLCRERTMSSMSSGLSRVARARGRPSGARTSTGPSAWVRIRACSSVSTMWGMKHLLDLLGYQRHS